MTDPLPPKPVIWVGSSKKDFDNFPVELRSQMGYALYLAQLGARHPQTKMMHGLGTGVVEILHHGDAFRTIYTVRFPPAVFVLHAFQKKSTSGAATPKPDIDLVLRRLRDARTIANEFTK